jgi:hypothetical protein
MLQTELAIGGWVSAVIMMIEVGSGPYLKSNDTEAGSNYQGIRF